MKILITTDWNLGPVNGVVVSMKNLESELVAMGHEVKFLTVSDSLKNEYSDRVIGLGSISVEKIYPCARVRIRSARKAYRMIEEWGPDVIHSQCELGSFIMAKALKRRLHIPIVHTYHTVYEDYTHYFCPSEKLGRRLVAFFSRQVSKKCDVMIAPTTKVARLLERYRVKCPVRVIPSGIDTLRYKNILEEAEIKKMKAGLEIPEGNLVAMFVGRMAKEKNLESLLDYWKEMKPQGVTFVIVGGGPYAEVIKKHAEKLGITDSVRFAGMVDKTEVWKYYSIGDFFMNASTSETQGLTYIEALASGLPLLARKDECLEDVVIEGVNGYCFETYEDFKICFDRLCDFFRSGRTDRGEISATVDKFSKKEFAAKVLELYSYK